MKSRNYSESEKFAAVERFLVGGESVATIAADTGISRSTLYAWIKSAQIEPGMVEFTRKNFRMLEAKVKRLEGIVEILQIANCTANAPLNEKLQALEELAEHSTIISSGTNGTILGMQREERNFESEFNKSMMKVSKSLEQERLPQL